VKSNLTGTNPSIVDACPPSKQAPSQRVPRNLYGRGGQNPKAVLSEAEVLDIYRSTEPVFEVAERYGVNRNTVSMIRHGRRWGWLTQGQGRAEGDAA
jgi:hypothetical protein